MNKCAERFPACITVTTCVRGDTPPPQTLNQLKAFLNRIGHRNQSPSWSAAQFWMLAGPTDPLAVEWTYAPGCSIGAVLERQDDGSCVVVRGGLNVNPVTDDEAVLARDEHLFGLSLGVRTDLEYGPRQVLQWLGDCAPGPSRAEARAARDSREEEPLQPASNHDNGLPAAAVNGSHRGWDD